MRKYQQTQRKKRSIKLLISLCGGKWCFPGGSDSKEFTCEKGGPGSIPGLGRSPEGGHGNPLQYSCLGNPMDRGAWRVMVHAAAAAAAAKSLQSCPTPCDPIDGSPPGSAVPGILQARTLEWVAISFSNA